MNRLTKLYQCVQAFRCLHLESRRGISRNLRLIHTLTKSLTTNLESEDSNLNPFASCSKVKQPGKILQDFISREDIRSAALEDGISKGELPTLLNKFAGHYSKNWSDHLDISVLLSDIEENHRHISDLLPMFLHFAYLHRSIDQNVRKSKIVIKEFFDDYHKSFLDAREFKRKVIIHAGSTNSGKTYQAMQSFLKAESGIYAAPLRMLAYETYVRTNNEGVDCDMLTGEEKKYKNSVHKPSAHISCTMELVPTDMAMFKVGVLDEIQLIGDPERGGSWTRALLGICCEELHVCGHNSSVNIVRRLLQRTGETVDVRTYERLTPLTLAGTHLNSDFTKLRPGDCMITFSRSKLHALKAQVEACTGMKCAIIYGNLPPRVRLEQMKLFNDPNSQYDVLVSSDAIGLGVNLNIKRIIFEDFYKISMGIITPHLTKQIAGRAGRYLSLYPEGEVTCFKAQNYKLLKHLFSAPIPDIPKAVISPSSEVWTSMDYMMPGHDLMKLLDLMKLTDNSDFQLICERNLIVPNELFKKVGIPLVHSLSLMSCFVDLKNRNIRSIALDILSAQSDRKVVRYEDVLYISSWPRPPPVSDKDLDSYELMSDICDFYLWLHQRDPLLFPDKFRIRELQIQIARIIGDTLRRPCAPTKFEVLYIPDSDFGQKFLAYYDNVQQLYT